MRILLTACALSMVAGRAPAVELPHYSAAELITRSIQYHDPEGRWWNEPHRVRLVQPRPGGKRRITEFTLYPDTSRFSIRMEQDGLTATAELRDGKVTLDATAAARETFSRLDAAGLRFWRDYYGYLFSAPMNLLDHGTTLDADVEHRTFIGRRVLCVQLTYAEGQPVWKYYFDPQTYALRGCSFSSDGTDEHDGEYIYFSDEIASGGIRLPRSRKWHMNVDRKFIGEDRIESFSRLSGEH